MSETPLQTALRLHQSGNFPEAARVYADILRGNPNSFEALNGLGAIYLLYRRLADAERLLGAATRLQPDAIESLYNHGCALMGLDRHTEALTVFARVLSIKPDLAEARNNRGLALLALDRHREALAAFDRALAERPELILIHGNRARALIGLQEYEQALLACDLALKDDANAPGPLFSKGAALSSLGRQAEALAQFDLAVAADPNQADAHNYRGIVLAMLERHAEALESYGKALEIAPGDTGTLFNRSTSYFALKRFQDAAADCDRVLRLDPHFKYARGNRLYSRLHSCDWLGFDKDRQEILAQLHQGARILRPLQSMILSQSPADHLQCARLWQANECPPASTPLWRGQRRRHERLRVAYISADFRDHPVAALAAGVFEHHDRSRFETIAVSLSSDDGSELGNRLRPAFDRFVDGRNRGDDALARMLFEWEADIAVDLMGFTENAATGILARRPAPVQVNFLGFPGSMGSPYIDYIVADKIVAPESAAHLFDEKIAYLPDCYLPADNRRPAAVSPPSRAEADLPDDGFVFCSFNSPHKIAPDMFAIWMRLLAQVPGSVLWLNQATPTAIGNLRREAEARGIAGARIVFAPFVPDSEAHLARLSLADLFLDTLPYNAHAGAIDALWAGVPLVTLAGQAFPGRVGASLLNALGLPELVSHSPQEYEALALGLAQDSSSLAAIRAKLVHARLTQPLFDTARFTRNLEAAYLAMWRRHEGGASPQSFHAIAQQE